MEHNSLAGIACARPIIYAEGLFAPCHLQNGKFIPEEGLDQHDLCTILNGEFFKSGSDLVEDFTLKTKLNQLKNEDTKSYELAEFPKDLPYAESSTCVLRGDQESKERDRQEIGTIGIPLVQIRSPVDERTVFRTEEDRVRTFFEKQVSWLMGDDGEEFVVMETFSEFHEAMILLDVLKKNNVPSVISFLARRNEPVAISFSKIQIGLDCLMFCLFQA